MKCLHASQVSFMMSLQRLQAGRVLWSMQPTGFKEFLACLAASLPLWPSNTQ